MTRRTTVLLASMVLLITGVVLSAMPAGATRPQKIDPAQLALPQSALPPGTVIDHAGLSDNADADGTTTPPDGHKAQIYQVHSKKYADLGRIDGYREDLHFTLQGSAVGTEYLASEFGSADQAKAAMQDVIGSGSLVSIIGTPLPQACTVGDACSAYSGPVPGSSSKAVFAVFVHGSILVETASAVPGSSFDQIEPALETNLYGLLSAADAQIKAALGITQSAPATFTPTATATDTPVPPTATPTPKAKTAKKKRKIACKKGYKLVHGKCKKVKKHK